MIPLSYGIFSCFWFLHEKKKYTWMSSRRFTVDEKLLKEKLPDNYHHMFLSTVRSYWLNIIWGGGGGWNMFNVLSTKLFVIKTFRTAFWELYFLDIFFLKSSKKDLRFDFVPRQNRKSPLHTISRSWFISSCGVSSKTNGCALPSVDMNCYISGDDQKQMNEMLQNPVLLYWGTYIK